MPEETPLISRGIPIPHSDLPLDLNHLFITNPPATFFMDLQTDFLRSKGLHKNDFLILDRSLNPKPNMYAVFESDNEFKIKKLFQATPTDIFWGSVTGLIRKSIT